MSDLQSLINRLSIVPASTQSYVYYNKENSKIHKISSKNIAEEGFEVFEIETNEVNPILTGERRTDEFVIAYDVSLKQLRLKEVAYDDSYNTAATMCYQLPMLKYTDSREYIDDFTKRQVLTPQYVGMHIDVWYDELSHLAGQHVWKNNNVYKVIKDQPANTKFNIDNAELIVKNVKLLSDENKELKIDNTIDIGDLILKNNSIFVFDFETVSNNEKYDIIIRQNTNDGVWRISLNTHTKKFLRMSGYNPKETLYFSITAKHDPNIFYRSLEFTVGDLVMESSPTIPFIYDVEHDANNVSIYTAKYFENYAHEII